MAWIWILLAAYAAANGQTVNALQARGGPQGAGLTLQQAAIEKQRASVRQQAAHLSLWMTPLAEGPPGGPREIAPPECDPITDDIAAPLIDSAAKANSVQPKLIRAVMEQESGLRPCAVSAKGAEGLMQLMPETAQELEVSDPFDPGQNVQAGAKYLKQLLDRYKGDVAQALGAYNAGANAVDQSGGIPDIPETRTYVNVILEKLGIKPGSGGK